jgi:hypothetical protein
MSITHVNDGAANAGTTSVALAQPASPLSGNIFVAHVSNRPFGSTPSPPTGYTQRTTGTSGSVANGADTGSVRATAFTHIVNGSESGSVTFGSVTSGNPTFGRIQQFSNATSLWDIAATTLTDTTETGTAVSATGSSIDIAAGDMLSVCVVIKSDSPTHTSQAIAVPGCTIGAITWLTTTTITNNDARIYIGRCTITAGSSSGAPTYTATSSVSGASSTAISLVRLREAPEGAGPSRNFNGTTDNLQFDVGALSGFTHGTGIFLVKLGALGAAFRTLLGFHTSGGTLRTAIQINTSEELMWWNGTSEFSTAITIPAANWLLIVTRKASGNTVARFSVYNYSTDTWSHDNTSSFSPGTSPGAGGHFFPSLDGSEGWLGNYAGMAVWSNTLPWTADASGDAAIVAANLHLAYQNWVDASPDVALRFNQAAVTTAVTDDVDAADQSARTGTTVQNIGPVGFDFELEAGVAEIQPDNMVHVHSVSSSTLTQVHTLAPAGLAHVHSVTSPSLTQTHMLSPASMAHTLAVGSPALFQVHELTPAGLAHVLSIGSPVLTQVHEIDVNDLVHVLGVGSPVLTQVHELSVNGLVHALVTASPSIQEIAQISPNSMVHALAVGSPALSQVHELIVSNLIHTHSIGSPGVSQVYIISPHSLIHALVSESPSLTQVHEISPDQLAHVLGVGSPVLSQVHQLSVNGLTHAHSVGSPGISQVHSLSPHGLVHALIHGSPNLSQVHQIGPDDLVHLLVIDEVFVGTGPLIDVTVLVGPSRYLGVLIGNTRGSLLVLDSRVNRPVLVLVSRANGVSLANSRASGAAVDDSRTDGVSVNDSRAGSVSVNDSRTERS